MSMLPDGGEQWKFHRHKPDAETLRRLYEDERLTQEGIADRFGVSRSAIQRWMKQAGIAFRKTTSRRDLTIFPHPHIVGAMLVPLGKGFHAIIDEDDVCRIEGRAWHAIVSKTEGLIYAASCESILMHRWLFGLGKTDGRVFVDHANRNGLDNRRSNLRLANSSQNRMNNPKGKSKYSKYKGVFKSTNGTNLFSRIVVNGKHFELGCYKSIGETAFAYTFAASLLHDPRFTLLVPIDQDDMPSPERQEEIKKIIIEKIKLQVASQKSRINASSRYGGVRYHKGKWFAQTHKARKEISFGFYENEKEAAYAAWVGAGNLMMPPLKPFLNPNEHPTGELAEKIRHNVVSTIRKCLSGHKRGVKLMANQVRDIHDRLNSGCTQSALAEEYQVSVSLICMIAKGKCWKDV